MKSENWQIDAPNCGRGFCHMLESSIVDRLPLPLWSSRIVASSPLPIDVGSRIAQ